MSDHQRYVAEYERLQRERDRYRNEAHVLTYERDTAISELERLKHYSEIRDVILDSAVASLKSIYDLPPSEMTPMVHHSVHPILAAWLT
jgi:hypothetical protein